MKMLSRARRVRVLAVFLFTAGLIATTPEAVAQGFRWPDKMENAKVLPENTSAEELGQIMRGFTDALGVRCNHCHVGEGPLSEFDFVSDDKPEKEIARTMIAMVQEVNESYIAKLGKENSVRVMCITCHHGVKTPMTLEAVVLAAIEKDGVDAAVARYRELREAYFGSAAYDFSEGTLLGVGQRVGEAGDSGAAVSLFRLNTEFFPESGNTWMLLGQALIESGQKEQGIESLEKALDLITNPRARQRVQTAIDEARKG